MYTHADPKPDTAVQQVQVPQTQELANESMLPFKDMRPETALQRDFHEKINDSPQVRQLKAVQEMVDARTSDKPIQLQQTEDFDLFGFKKETPFMGNDPLNYKSFEEFRNAARGPWTDKGLREYYDERVQSRRKPELSPEELLKKRSTSFFGSEGPVPKNIKAKFQVGINRLAQIAVNVEANKWLKNRVESFLGPTVKKMYGFDLVLPENPLQVILLTGNFNAAETVKNPRYRKQIQDQRKGAIEMHESSPDIELRKFLVMGFTPTGQKDMFFRQEAFDFEVPTALQELDETILHEGLHTLGVPGLDKRDGVVIEPFINMVVKEFFEKFPPASKKAKGVK